MLASVKGSAVFVIENNPGIFIPPLVTAVFPYL